nr:uncharacterized protein LOC119167045 isoform X1 [Rhipicephalus microplus]XP_037274465.1 uncharacterized protein LOC119167134 isoform X1 [Rhipicephalus microplus]XP_037289097.1 uncharacterized protein LOC119182067 isoform X1 [Rhipicephalus microplus]
MSTPIQCLVSWKERKKIISINGHTMEDVLAAVKATDFGDVASTGRIEVYNAQFEAYVDPPGNHVFCDGSKIRIITDEAMPHACSTNELLVVSPELEPSTTQPFHGSDYRLPPLPLDLKVAIGNTELGKVSSRTKSRIVSWLSHHLMNFTVYPGRRLYEAASKALVVEYPVLRDTIGTGWEAKEVYGKRKPQDSAIAAQTKRQRRVTTSIPYDDHDEGVLVGHLEFMSKEMSKRAPDLQKLSESMKQTRSSRRSWMKDTVPTTAEILEKYPALGNVEMLHEEFTAITSIQMEKKLLEFFNNFGPRILELLKTRHSTKDLVKELEKELEKLEGNSRKYRFAVALIELLPLLLKEKPKFLRGPDIYPALCFEGTSIREAEEMTVVFEAFNIHVVDVIAGMTAIMELYWVLDIMYSESNKNTLTLLEYFCGLPSVPRAPLLLRTISSIKS